MEEVKLLLYHGSNQIAEKPILIKRNRLLDFGFGFYATSNEEQAINFARKVDLRRGGKPIVNVYGFPLEKKETLSIKEYPEPNGDWLDFIAMNRNGAAFKTPYDLIIGPVANDDVYRTVSLYLSGFLSKESALEALKVKKPFNQYVFVSNKALETIEFLKASEV